MKIINILFRIFPLALILIACNNPQSEDYLIPQGYKGRVNIVFNQKQGANIRYENGRRVYKIPASGILLTQFKDEYGITDRHYYYVDNSDKRAELKIYKFQYNKDGTTKWVIENPLETGVFLDGTTGGYGGKDDFKFQEFLISDYKDLDIYYDAKYKENFEKRLQNLLNEYFTPGSLNEAEMDSIENQLNKKRVPN